MLAYLYLSTHRLTVTATVVATGAPLSGATVTAVIEKRTGQAATAGGVALGTLTLQEIGETGNYFVQVPHNLDDKIGTRLRASITATKDGIQRFARVPILVTVDDD